MRREPIADGRGRTTPQEGTLDLQAATDALAALPPVVFYGVIGAAAFVEYVFPPFPGDSAVVAGTALGVATGGSPAPVFLATTIGAVAGAAVDLAFGERLARSDWRGRLGPVRAERVARLVTAYGRFGAPLLLANRFVPGVRGLFFVAAGLAGVRRGPALAAAAGSAMAWNLLLVAIGSIVGWNLDRVSELLAAWSVGVGLFVVAVGGAVVLWWRRAGRPSSD